jgi:hypothetical protein
MRSGKRVFGKQKQKEPGDESSGSRFLWNEYSESLFQEHYLFPDSLVINPIPGIHIRKKRNPYYDNSRNT